MIKDREHYRKISFVGQQALQNMASSSGIHLDIWYSRVIYIGNLHEHLIKFQRIVIYFLQFL